VKVVFIEDVPNVAEVGQVREVADGYARNFLIPRKLAVLANSAASNILDSQLKKKVKIQAQTEAEMTELAKLLEGSEITLQAKVGAKERLYGSITSSDIAEGISNSLGLEIDKRKIELAEPIRELGNYEVPVRLFKEIMPKIKLAVLAEEKAGEAKKESKEKKADKAEEKAAEEEEVITEETTGEVKETE